MAGNSSDRLEDLQFKREQARLGGGLKRQEAIRASGRGTARDRISLLLDEESFIEIDSFITHRTTDNGMFLHQTMGDGVVAGHGTIDGRRVYCFAQLSTPSHRLSLTRWKLIGPSPGRVRWRARCRAFSTRCLSPPVTRKTISTGSAPATSACCASCTLGTTPLEAEASSEAKSMAARAGETATAES